MSDDVKLLFKRSPLRFVLTGFVLSIYLTGFSSLAQSVRYVQIITLETEKKASEIVKLLRDGQDFGTLAREHSTHETAHFGGYWGPISDSSITKEFSRRLADSNFGAVILFQHKNLGYTLLRKVDSREARSAQSQIWLEQGDRLLSQGQGDLALEAFKKAVTRDPGSARAHMMLGYTYRFMGSYEMIAEAKAELRQAIALDPLLDWARFYLARVYVDLGRLEKAKEELEAALASKPDNAFFLAFLGDVNRQLGDTELSIQQNRKAIELSPDLSLAYYYLGLAYTELGDRNQARRELEKAVRCKEVLPEMYLALGTTYLEDGEYSDAIVEFKRALNLDSKRAESHLQLARAYRRSGRLKLAEKEIKIIKEDQMVQIHSPYFQKICADASYELGMIFQTRGKMSQARDSYLEAVRVNQSYGLAHKQLAEVFFILKDYPYAQLHAIQAEAHGEPVDAELMQKIRDKAVN